MLQEQDIEVKMATVISTNEISQVLPTLVQKVGAMFAVTDNTIGSSITLVGDIAKSIKLLLLELQKHLYLQK